MRYIGGKTLMLDSIASAIVHYTEGVRVVTDIFAGTGAVAFSLKTLGYSVIANDLLYFAYVLNRGRLEMDGPVSGRLRECVAHLNGLSVESAPWFDVGTAFIYQHYSPHAGSERMYLRSDNALKVDLVRQEIERLRGELSEAEYYYLLSLLIEAVPSVSNITGTYGAYLKYWDRRTYNPLRLVVTPLPVGGPRCRCFNLDAEVLAGQVESDLTYLDPPYNGRQYLPNYHLLETIARYDYPQIKGVTGQRADTAGLSDFCRRCKAEEAFRRLLRRVRSRYVLLSYNNEGLLSTETLSGIVRECGISDTFRLLEYDYRRYKNKIPNERAGLKEQLYFIEKAV